MCLRKNVDILVGRKRILKVKGIDTARRRFGDAAEGAG
jgi:hypothetical protein